MNALATKPKAAEPPVMPETLRIKLSEAKARHAALTAEQFRLAEASVSDPKAEDLYRQTIEKMSAAHADIERIEIAISAMGRRATEQHKAAEAAEIRSLQGRVVAMLEQRLEAAREFEAAATELVRAMHRIASLSKSAWEAWPKQHPTMAGLAVSLDELNILIGAELFRLGGARAMTGGVAGSAGMALPPPKAPTLQTAGEPSSVTPLVEAICAANIYAQQLLET